MSNERMSLEIAASLACLTNRQLILYGDAGSSFELHATRGGWYRLSDHGWLDSDKPLPEYRASTILDLYDDLPAPTFNGNSGGHPESWFSGEGSNISVFNHQLGGWCYVPAGKHPNLSLNSIVESHTRRAFADGRSLLSIPTEKVWRMEGSNLSFYSRFFFDPTNTVSKAIQGMKLKPWIASLADRVSERLGVFNGCHIRLTDFRKFMPQASDYHEAVAAVLEESLPTDHLLVIATDEETSHSFFSPIRQRFPRLIFLDDYLRTECDDLWREAEFINESVLGLICQLVLERSLAFLGTPGSTFTGLIHRGWLSRQLRRGASLRESPFQFIHSGISGSPATVPG